MLDKLNPQDIIDLIITLRDADELCAILNAKQNIPEVGNALLLLPDIYQKFIKSLDLQQTFANLHLPVQNFGDAKQATILLSVHINDRLEILQSQDILKQANNLLELCNEVGKVYAVFTGDEFLSPDDFLPGPTFSGN